MRRPFPVERPSHRFRSKLGSGRPRRYVTREVRPGTRRSPLDGEQPRQVTHETQEHPRKVIDHGTAAILRRQVDFTASQGDEQTQDEEGDDWGKNQIRFHDNSIPADRAPCVVQDRRIFHGLVQTWGQVAVSYNPDSTSLPTPGA